MPHNKKAKLHKLLINVYCNLHGGYIIYTMGIDLGETNIAGDIIDENMNIVDKSRVPAKMPRSADTTIKDMVSLAIYLAKRNSIKKFY